VPHILVAHKDRLARFGYDFIEEFASWYGCQITVVNQESLSPQQEMVEDLMSVVHCFSCRLYGLRNYKKQIKKIAQTAPSLARRLIEQARQKLCDEATRRDLINLIETIIVYKLPQKSREEDALLIQPSFSRG
jgi:hypothetical protein